jgi:hypothetical protein
MAAIRGHSRGDGAVQAAQEEFEQALAEQLEARAHGFPFADPTGPFYRWRARRKLGVLERRYAAGDRFALMHAIRVCANYDLAMPLWVALAYIEGFDRVLHYRADSWDDAFGRPFPKGGHLARARLRHMRGPQVYVRIMEILKSEKGATIDDGLFERVGKELGVSKTLCSKLYYQQKKLGEAILNPHTEIGWLLSDYRRSD